MQIYADNKFKKNQQVLSLYLRIVFQLNDVSLALKINLLFYFVSVLKNEPEKALECVKQALNEIPIQSLNYSSLKKLKSSLEAINKEFPYDIVSSKVKMMFFYCLCLFFIFSQFLLLGQFFYNVSTHSLD